MKIVEITKNLPIRYRVVGNEQTEVSSLSSDSRKVSSGCLFFCVPGMHIDAHDLAPEVVQKGAAALVVERVLDVDCVQILVENVRLAMSYLAANFFGNPTESLKIIGITGTKGKTTTSYLVKSILEAAGYATGLIGTVGTIIGNRILSAGKTTPDPIEFQQTMREMVNAGMRFVVMEVSAHALAMHRVAGIRFLSSGFSNLSQDHLDFFGTMENYLEAKMAITDMSDHMAVNVDDERVYEAMRRKGVSCLRTGIREPADVYAREIEFTESGLSFRLCFHKKFEQSIQMKMTGIFNVYNAIMAAAVAYLAGVDAQAIKEGLESLEYVPGRIELLNTHTPYRVILDYAHSPDALENILTTVRATTKGRLIVVFGCGGGRDHLKRPIMGEIAGRLADFSILTSDNPRDEEPMSIIDAIEAGIIPTDGEYTIIENRRAAIREALMIAREGDAIVLAGKGHETYQEIKGVKHNFDEKIVVQELLDELAGAI